MYSDERFCDTFAIFVCMFLKTGFGCGYSAHSRHFWGNRCNSHVMITWPHVSYSREWRTKFNLVWNDNETIVNYDLNVTYSLEPNMSSGDPKKDKIITLNIPLYVSITDGKVTWRLGGGAFAHHEKKTYLVGPDKLHVYSDPWAALFWAYISSHQQGIRTACLAHHRFIYAGCTRTIVAMYMYSPWKSCNVLV